MHILTHQQLNIYLEHQIYAEIHKQNETVYEKDSLYKCFAHRLHGCGQSIPPQRRQVQVLVSSQVLGHLPQVGLWPVSPRRSGEGWDC